MNPVSYVWFWIAIVAIIAIIIAYSFSEGVGQSFGNKSTTPLWVWILWGVGILLLIVSFIMYCISASRNYKAKLIAEEARKLEEACNPKPKEPIVCPVKKPCGCAIEVKCTCVHPVAVAVPDHHHKQHAHATPVQVSPISYHLKDGAGQIPYSYPDINQPHLYYGANTGHYAGMYAPAPALAEPVNINIQEPTANFPAVPTAPVYNAFPQAPGYAPLTTG